MVRVWNFGPWRLLKGTSDSAKPTFPRSKAFTVTNRRRASHPFSYWPDITFSCSPERKLFSTSLIQPSIPITTLRVATATTSICAYSKSTMVRRSIISWYIWWYTDIFFYLRAPPSLLVGHRKGPTKRSFFFFFSNEARIKWTWGLGQLLFQNHHSCSNRNRYSSNLNLIAGLVKFTEDLLPFQKRNCQ